MSRDGKEIAAMAEEENKTEGTEPEGNEPEENEPEGTESATDDGDKGDKAGDSGANLGDAGKRTLSKLRRELSALKKERDEHAAKLKEIADKDKSETQRLSEAAEEAKTRASSAEQSFRKLQVAMDHAPEGATLTQIRAVAKRLSGDSDEELEADADELFGLFGKSTSDTGKEPAGRPKEKLRGGRNPEVEPEETDPRKLAALIGRP